MIMELIFYFLIFATAILAGLLLAWLCKEELVAGRRWFRVIFFVLVVLFIVALLFYQEPVILLTLAYMLIVVQISLYKSYDKKFLRN